MATRRIRARRRARQREQGLVRLYIDRRTLAKLTEEMLPRLERKFAEMKLAREQATRENLEAVFIAVRRKLGLPGVQKA